MLINQFLLENGYAHEYTYSKKYEKQSEFKALEASAKNDKLGLWGSLCLQK